MKRNVTNAFAKGLLFAILSYFYTPALIAQNGTSDDGFLVEITLPNGEKQLHTPGYGGYGGATFGGDVTDDFETDVVWARTDAGDSLGCNPVVNFFEIAGKAALVRRGGCPFQQKANNVEAAGAAVMIVVNHSLNAVEDEFFTLDMAPSAGLPDVTIPCIFLNRASSVQIAAALDAGLPVKVKFLYPLLSEGVAAYHFATPVSQVRALDYVGVSYTNRSPVTVTDVTVKADIVEPDGNVVSMLALAPPAGPYETVFVGFPSYTPPAVQGRFDVFFSTNKYLQQYDTVKTSFILTENTFATDNFNLTPSGVGPSDALFSWSTQYQTAGLCYTGSQGGLATHVTFGIANAADVYVPGDPGANTIYSFVFDADFDNDGQIDPFYDFFELSPVGLASYEMQGNEAPNALLNLPLTDFNTGDPSVPLLPDHPYYVNLWYDGSLGTGKSVNFSASREVDYLNFPTTPIFLDQQYTGGWRNFTVAQRLQLEGFSPDDPQPPTPPVASFNNSANDLTVAFTNKSLDAVTYAWDFGDGNTSTEEHPIHTYTAAGIYTVKLIATNTAGSHAVLHVIDVGNNAAPVAADFITNVNGGCVPVIVEYTDASS
ncbi:MAG TPA: PKD domain-containing protein, partial [Saprospiraceae bacterium]|nr:PKD domain-containing protein [Saprospiraceae bacterium]